MKFASLVYPLAVFALGSASAQDTFEDDSLVVRDPFMIAWNPIFGPIGAGLLGNPKSAARKDRKKSKDLNGDDDDDDDEDEDEGTDNDDAEDDTCDSQDEKPKKKSKQQKQKQQKKKKKKKSKNLRSIAKKPLMGRRDDLEEILQERNLLDVYDHFE